MDGDLGTRLPDGRALSIADEAADRLSCGILVMSGVQVRDNPAVAEATSALGRDLAQVFQGLQPSEIPGLTEARNLYKSFGMDPSRHRPSSEALLRRALKGMELYRIDAVVDLGNLISLRHQLPLGLYDLGHVEGEVVRIRVGEEGAAYEGIRKGEVHLAGRLCVVDDAGPFGSPTSDSHRTRIRPTTERVLAILFAPIEGERQRLLAAGEDLGAAFREYAAATAIESRLLEP